MWSLFFNCGINYQCRNWCNYTEHISSKYLYRYLYYRCGWWLRGCSCYNFCNDYSIAHGYYILCWNSVLFFFSCSTSGDFSRNWCLYWWCVFFNGWTYNQFRYWCNYTTSISTSSC